MITARESAARLADLLSRERSAMAEFLVALADFDRKRLWEQLGHAGLFPFLCRELSLSKAAAFYRKTAAELIQRFPEIVEPLRDGHLCLTVIAEVAKVITPENRAEMLPRFFHCSSREAKQVAAEIAPLEAPPMREVVTPIRSDPSPQRTVRAHEPTQSEIAVGPACPATPPRASPAPTAKPDAIQPLTAELNRFHVTVSRRFLEKLDRARDALSHSHPGASAEAILEVGLDLLLARDAKRKGLVAKPRSAPPPHPGPLPRSRGGEGRGSSEIPGSVDRGEESGSAEIPASAKRGENRRGSRWIPASVKRAVWIRDRGRCQWPLESGGICGSTHAVEFDHVDPWACGGPATVENIRIACKSHNGLAARLFFGEEWIDRCKRRGAAERSAGPSNTVPSRPTPPPP